jgi:hypothetical protein
MRTSNSISALAILACSALLLRATACLDTSACLRNSDCSNGFVCMTQMCVPPPLDGGEGGTPIDDASNESSVDAADASVDAADSSDSSNDANDASNDVNSDSAVDSSALDASDSG